MVSIVAQGLEEHENALKEWVRMQLQKARAGALKLAYTGVLGVSVCFKFKAAYIAPTSRELLDPSPDQRFSYHFGWASRE